MTTAKMPLKGRTFERTQGCWNCQHAGDPATVGLVYWTQTARPRDEKKLVAPFKLALLALPADDHQMSTRGKRSRLLKQIEDGARVIDAFGKAIGEGLAVRCTNRLCKDPGEYKSHRFLCDQWSGATGASVARAGGAADKLPEEMMDIHGDGN